MTTKSKALPNEQGKFFYIKIKNFGSSKTIIKRVKRQTSHVREDVGKTCPSKDKYP